MIASTELKRVARARLRDSQVLCDKGRYDGAIYLCGYSVEIALKARICKTLKWAEFPLTNNEFKTLQSFKTHDLDVLLKLSGIQEKIKTRYFAEWSLIATWDPEVRYKTVGSATKTDAVNLIQSANVLVKVL
jgi:HEPN domain-containing protein